MHGTHGCGPGRSERRSRRESTEREERRQRRKERILHTRVSDHLAEDIRRVAEDLRVPVSNLVRNVLEEAFSVVERVSDDVGDLLGEVIGEAERARERMERFGRRRRRSREAGEDAAPPEDPAPQQEFPDVVAWQSVLLNREQRCASDGRLLAAGEKAFMGLAEAGPAQAYLCADCMEARRTN